MQENDVYFMIETFDDIEKHLDSLGLFHMKPGQDRMNIALEKLGLLPLPYKSVQIVGTNGKGSTSTFLSYLAKEHDFKTGLYTSPHFVSVKERILYQNAPISDNLWVEAAKKVYAANSELTYFEFLTVLAALLYKELEVDIAFFEAGLGGKFDATTALLAQATVFTPFDIDHVNVLGNNLQDIAKDKAQALHKESLFAYSAMQKQEAKEEIINVCNALDVDCPFIVKQRYNYKLKMQGAYQQENAHLAVMAWRVMAREFFNTQSHRFKEEKALEKAFIPGRLQIIPAEISPIKNKTIILDGAHNVHGLKELLPALINLNKLPNSIIFSCLDDKDIAQIIPLIAQIAKQKENCKIYVPTIKENPRAFEAEKLTQELKKCYSQVSGYINLDEILKHLKNEERQNEENLLICGSLYLLSEFYANYNDFLFQ